MTNDGFNIKLVLTTFEIFPYDILILQNAHGELITIKIYDNGFGF